MNSNVRLGRSAGTFDAFALQVRSRRSMSDEDAARRAAATEERRKACRVILRNRPSTHMREHTSQFSRKGLIRAAASLYLVVFLLALSSSSAESTVAQQYARAYEDELTGTNLADVVRQYRALAELAGARDSGFAARALFRAGVCERKLGRPAAARETFRRLVDGGSGEPSLLARARREIQALDDELRRVTIRGRVVDDKGNPVEGACVMTGQWGVELPMLTGKDGSFTAERRIPERGVGEDRYCLLYAEHPTLPLVLFDTIIFSKGDSAPVTAALKPAAVIGGRVKDQNGRPVAGAFVIATAVSPGRRDIPIPADRVLAPVMTLTNGQFWVGGLDPALRWRFAARKEGYRMLRALETGPNADGADAGEIALEALSALSVAGIVHDRNGRPLQAAIEVWTMPPDIRKAGETQTDERGRYLVLNLPDEPVTVKVAALSADPGQDLSSPSAGAVSSAAREAQGTAPRSSTAILERSLTSIRPSDGVFVDFELGGEVAPSSRIEVGKPAPDLAVVPLRGGSLRLADCRGQSVVLHFWSRQEMVHPPSFIQRLAGHYAKKGVRVICVHDQSGSPADLVSASARHGIMAEMALDTYVPAADQAAMNSATWARYGARRGFTVLIDREGVVQAAGMAGDPAFQARLEEMIGVRQSEAGPMPRLFPPQVAVVGQPVPPLRVARWIRGDPATGGAPGPGDVRRRVTIYHFGSAYIEQSLRDQYPRELGALTQALRTYGHSGVTGVWILPDTENDETVKRMALELTPAALIAVDRSGETYRTFGAGETSGNIVADEKGIVASICTDQQLFRVVKDLAAREGRLPERSAE